MKNFNIRVYGILSFQSQILLVKERVKGIEMLKFPGGGLEWGEGPEQTFQREIQEELGIEVPDFKHFYTTGFFQQSAFNANDQLISIYYTSNLSAEIIRNIHIPEHEDLSIVWKELTELIPEELTFPVDKNVAKKLKEMGLD